MSKFFKLNDSKHSQLKLSIVSITLQLQNISMTTVLLHGNLELLDLVLFFGKLVRILFHNFREVLGFLNKRMATYRIKTHSKMFQCF